jgi:DNA-binding PadR family transcriptional regulator
MSGIVQELRERVVKDFLDVFILSQLTKEPMGGYGLMGLIHKKFDMLISSGTVYTRLYSLERAGLIKAEADDRSRVYTLTKKGMESLQKVKKANGDITNLIRVVLPFNDTSS